jgi:hypothetical protein
MESPYSLQNASSVLFSSFVLSVLQSSGDNPMTEVDELKKNFRAVQEENYKLQAVITDVSTQPIDIKDVMLEVYMELH